MKKSFFCYLICLSFVLFSVNSCFAAIKAVNAVFSDVFSFERGDKAEQLLWLTDEQGQCVCGSLTGPMAFVFDDDNSLWAADTQNARICRFNKDGKNIKIIDLEALGKKAGLPAVPAIADMRLNGNKIIAADANNNVILEIDIYTERMRVLPPQKTEAEGWVQINYIHTDCFGQIYVEDLASQKTVVINSSGAPVKVLENRNGLAVNTQNGNIAALLFDEESADEANAGNYKIILSNGCESDFKVIATIDSDEQILWVSMLGFDKNETIYVAYETADSRFYNAYSSEGRLIKSLKTAQCDSGYEPMRPDWVSNEGKIYNAGVDNRVLKINLKNNRRP